MKNLLMSLFAITVVSVNVNGQELKSKKGESYLPEKGDWSIGFNADGIFSYVGNAFNGTLGNNAPSVDFQSPGTFVGKKFITANTAYRATANLAVGTTKSGDNTNSGFDVTVGLGKEWRKGQTRLQGYYGADGLLSLSSNTTKSVVGVVTTETKSGMGIGFGVQGFMGAEYFIFPKISMGAQYTYGLQVFSQAASKTTVTGQPTVEGTKSSSFGLSGVGVTSINVNFHF